MLFKSFPQPTRGDPPLCLSAVHGTKKGRPSRMERPFVSSPTGFKQGWDGHREYQENRRRRCAHGRYNNMPCSGTRHIIASTAAACRHPRRRQVSFFPRARLHGSYQIKVFAIWMAALSALSAGMAEASTLLGAKQGIVVPRIQEAGILFFGYGGDNITAEYYLKQAAVSARRIKELNPTTNITVVCNPGVVPEDMGVAFDMVINIEEDFHYPGKRQTWDHANIKKQWLTRLEYMARSPYKVTLALDSQALCCSNGVNDILDAARTTDFDIAFPVQGPRHLESYNWAILYRRNAKTRRLFKRWNKLQRVYDNNGSDQGTLFVAAGSLALQGRLNAGVLSQNVAMATVIYSHEVRPYPKSSGLVSPGPIYFLHYDAVSREDEIETCAKVNQETDRARVVVLPRPFPKSPDTHLRTENVYEMVYSEEELARAVRSAREGHPFFEGLDWDNTDRSWGKVATPWMELYPNCREVLAKEVTAGIRKIFKNPADLWETPKFVEEFSEDTLDWMDVGRTEV